MVTDLTRESFCEKIYDLTNLSAKSLVYRGLVPAVVLFGIRGAWMDSMIDDVAGASEGLNGNGVAFYFVDANASADLVAQLGIRVMPTMLFIPMTGDPTIVMGLADRAGIDGMLQKLVPRSIITL